MQVEIIFEDIDMIPILLETDFNNRFILVKGNYIEIDGYTYRIDKIKGIYEELELVKIQVKVYSSFDGDF